MSSSPTGKSADPARLRPGRPSVEQGEAIDAAIFETARRLFVTVGFDKTSMEMIAACAEVSRTTLYARFKNKEVLLHAVIDAQLKQYASSQQGLRESLSKDFKQRMHQYARATMKMLISSDVREFMRLLGNAAASDAKYAQALNSIGYRPAIDLLAREISEGCRDLPVPPRNPTQVAEMLMAFLQGWTSVREHGEAITPEDACAYADQAVDILFFGRHAW